MTSVADNPSRTRSAARGRRAARRPHDAQASRQALLRAASELFDERGYDATTVREIGERAGVDAALIARYFGGKEGLYLAALEQDGRPPLPGDPREAIAAILSRSDEQGIGPVPLAMVNPNLTDDMRAQLREITSARVLGPLTAELARRGVPDARLRAEVLLAATIGVILTRTSGSLPLLADAPVARVLEILDAPVEALQGHG
ncbi:MAG TPA: TetR family transcriptional regulator [Solirubrobacteraceae bacterium]|jgi:AcrR family transcriptional regulator